MKKILMVIMCLLICGCGKVRTEMPEDVHIEYKNNIIEVYSDLKIADIINDANVTIDNKDDKINTIKLGKQEIKVYYTYKKKKYVDKLKIEIVDTTKPRILSGPTKTTKIGEEYDFCKNVFFGDNYDKKPDCKIEGNVDINKVGTYNVKMVVTDSSGNFEDFNLKLNVVNEYKKSEPDNRPRLAFSEVIKNYKNDNTLVGIDVSRWQDKIDFTKVKEAGADFVLIRMGIQSDNDKEISVDGAFEENYKNAKDNGLLVGIYLYTSANTVDMVKNHVEWMIDVLDKKELDFPIAFDWENWSKWNKYNMSFYDINEVANTFIKTVEKSGYKGMLYSSKFYLENIWTNNIKYPVWLAHYTNNTNYEGEYFLWQMSNIGSIDGIKGDVDINILYKDKYEKIMGEKK